MLACLVSNESFKYSTSECIVLIIYLLLHQQTELMSFDLKKKNIVPKHVQTWDYMDTDIRNIDIQSKYTL